METRATAVMEADKVKHRLEQLDDLEDGGQQETLNLSQKEYIRKIDTMNRSLTDAWQRDQRVMSLKITIQVSDSAHSGHAHFHSVFYFSSAQSCWLTMESFIFILASLFSLLIYWITLVRK